MGRICFFKKPGPCDYAFTYCTVSSSKGNIISCLGIFVTPLSLILAECVCTVVSFKRNISFLFIKHWIYNLKMFHSFVYCSFKVSVGKEYFLQNFTQLYFFHDLYCAELLQWSIFVQVNNIWQVCWGHLRSVCNKRWLTSKCWFQPRSYQWH